MRPWERKLALTIGAFALGFALSTCWKNARAGDRAAYAAAFRAVICPPEWRATVSQRYDDRDRFDWIVKRTWITRCI